MSPANIINRETLIPLGLLIAIVSAVGGGVWLYKDATFEERASVSMQLTSLSDAIKTQGIEFKYRLDRIERSATSDRYRLSEADKVWRAHGEDGHPVPDIYDIVGEHRERIGRVE